MVYIIETGYRDGFAELGKPVSQVIRSPVQTKFLRFYCQILSGK